MKSFEKPLSEIEDISFTLYDRLLTSEDLSVIHSTLSYEKIHFKKYYNKIYIDVFLNKALKNSLIPLVILEALYLLFNFGANLMILSRYWSYACLIAILYFIILLCIEFIVYLAHVTYVTFFYSLFQKKLFKKIRVRNQLLTNKRYTVNSDETRIKFPINRNKSATIYVKESIILNIHPQLSLILGRIEYDYNFLPFYHNKKIHMVAIKTTNAEQSLLQSLSWKTI